MEIIQKGKLLEYYRKKNKLSVKELIQSPKGYPICSRQTYQAILEGKAIQYENEIFEELFQRVGERRSLKKISLDYSKLHMEAEYCHFEACLQECKDLLERLRPFEHCAEYDIQREALKLIQAYYENGKPCDEETIFRFLEAQTILDEKLKDVLFLVFGYFCKRTTYNERRKIEQRIYKESNFLPILISRLTRYNDSRQYGKAYHCIAEIKNRITEDNYCLRLDFYHQISNTYRALKLEYNDYLNYIKEILQDTSIQLPSRKRVQITGNLIIKYLEQKKHKESLILIESILEISGYRKLQLILFGLYCQSQLGLPTNTEWCSLDLSLWSDKKDMRMYHYFQKPQRTAKLKNEMALRILKKDLDHHDSIYLFMLEEEVKKNCRENNNSRILIEFLEEKNKKLSSPS